MDERRRKTLEKAVGFGGAAKILLSSVFFLLHFFPRSSPAFHRSFRCKGTEARERNKTPAMGRARRAFVVVAAVACASALGGRRHGAIAVAAASSGASGTSGAGRSLTATAPSSSITSADVKKTTLALLEAAELQAAISDSVVR